MLYLLRSQINVPRDHPLGNSSHLNVAEKVSKFETLGEVFDDSQDSKRSFLLEEGRGLCLFAFFSRRRKNFDRTHLSE